MNAIAPDEREKFKVVKLINRDQRSDHIHFLYLRWPILLTHFWHQLINALKKVIMF